MEPLTTPATLDRVRSRRPRKPLLLALGLVLVSLVVSTVIGLSGSRGSFAFRTGGLGSTRRATLNTFVGHWWGHTRGIDISHSGSGREYLNSGAPPVLELTFRVLGVTGTPSAADARIRITSVRVFDQAALGSHPTPRVGERGDLRLRHGVVTDSATHSAFCAPSVTRCGL